MRGTVAKRLRAKARATSAPTQRKIKWYAKLTGKLNDKGEPIKDYRGTITNTGYRKTYRDLKKEYNRKRRTSCC